MKFRWLLLFAVIFAFESFKVVLGDNNSAPQIGDAAEVHNIAYNLAHGRGYSFDWNDERWRELWQEQNADGRLDFVVVRRGSYPTMFRPPLMPIMVAAILKVLPHSSFLAWRLFDSAAFSAAACLLCDAAFALDGFAGLSAVLVLLMVDPLRRQYIPGWLTEGIAFDLLSLIVWLIVSRRNESTRRYKALAGLTVGLLCLDRSIFVLTIPLVCLALATARSSPRTDAAKSALAILAVSLLIQTPWWVRNIEISGRFLPLGTQGGFNLPDEYGDTAIEHRGAWAGWGIRDAWIPVSSATRPIGIPSGFSRESFRKIWPSDSSDDANNYRSAATLYAAVCTSLQSEIAVSSAGQRAAIAWIRANYSKLPELMAMKILALTFTRRRYLTVALLLAMVGFIQLRKAPRTRLCLVFLMASYVLAIALTHVVPGRFLVPILPPLYVCMACGTTAILRYVASRTRTASTRVKLAADLAGGNPRRPARRSGQEFSWTTAVRARVSASLRP